VRIREILQTKGSGVIVIGPDASVRDLVALLEEHNLGAVVVSTDGTTMAGIVSERDVVRRLATDEAVLDATVADVMTAVVHTCTPHDSVESLMATMTEHRIRHLPVLDDEGRLSGIVSIGDVVKSTITQLQFERDRLQEYVSAST
jgi:CBS domain-containing protein